MAIKCRKWYPRAVTYVAILLAILIYRLIYGIPPIPQVSKTKYWGPGKPPNKQDTSIRQFKIEFDEDVIEDLITRLNRTRYTEPLEHVASTYGIRHTELKKIVKFWLDEYDFQEREKYLNQYQHYKTNIQGLDIHYIHVRPHVPRTIKLIPILILHGWPGSVIEFYKIIPLLAKPKEGNDFAFEMVIPSLPGYGWSQSASKPGLGVLEMAAVMANLMERLEYEKYYVQGGDLGAEITSAMALLYPDNVLGYHTNLPVSRLFISWLRYAVGMVVPSWFVEEQYAHRVLPFSKIFNNIMYEYGYIHIQATKPDTLGASLGDSPAGLTAWLLEKFSVATNMAFRERDDSGLTVKFNLTELIDNVMIYWITNSATTAARIYAESFNQRYFESKWDKIPIEVPTAVAKFPHEISYYTNAQLRDRFPNLLQATDMPRGGHFAAMEEPQLLADDIISATKLFMIYHNKEISVINDEI